MSESLPTDGRDKYDWETKYDGDGRKHGPSRLMRIEAIYLTILLIISFVAIVANYKGFFLEILKIEEEDSLIITRIGYCLCAGMLGGVTFSIKIFYRAVARGQWNVDRHYWRIFSPLISLSVTSVVAAFMMEDIIGSHLYWAYTIGYFAGYFSENAVGKMYDIAVVLFSSPVMDGMEDADETNNDKSNSE